VIFIHFERRSVNRNEKVSMFRATLKETATRTSLRSISLIHLIKFNVKILLSLKSVYASPVSFVTF
jgi:hypothetical protein